jgi:hypothetical protein
MSQLQVQGTFLARVSFPLRAVDVGSDRVGVVGAAKADLAVAESGVLLDLAATR